VSGQLHARPLYPREKIPRIYWIGGWVDTEPVWTTRRTFLILLGLELRPLGRPARSQSLYRLRYPGSYIGFYKVLKLLNHWKFPFLALRRMFACKLREDYSTMCPQSPFGILKNFGAQTNWASHMRFVADEWNSGSSTIQKVLHVRLSLCAYKVQLVQQLKLGDGMARQHFAEEMLDRIDLVCMYVL
jgi:hypothetical protein